MLNVLTILSKPVSQFLMGDENVQLVEFRNLSDDNSDSVDKQDHGIPCTVLNSALPVENNATSNDVADEEDDSVSTADEDDTHTSLACDSRVGERYWTTTLAVLVASLQAVQFGCYLGFPSPALLVLAQLPNEDLRFDTTLSDIFGGVTLVGGMFGGPPGGWVADKWGRKMALLLNSVPYVAGYMMIVSANLVSHALTFKALLVAGRLVTGFASGWSFVAVSVYAGEISSARLRGIFGSFGELALVGGILLVYAIGSIPQFSYYHISLVLLGLEALFVLLGVWLPETPRWLLLKKNKPQALKVLKVLRGPKFHGIQQELSDIQTAIASSSKLGVLQKTKQFFQRSILMPFIIILVLMMFQEFCGGGSLVTSYAAPVFQSAGVPNPEIVSLFAIGGTQFLSTAIGMFLVDRLGRKLLLIVSTTGTFIGSTSLGVHFYITRPSLCVDSNVTFLATEDDLPLCNTEYFPLAVASLVVFIASFAIGLGPVLWVLLAEYIPLHIRGTVSGIVVLSNWLAAALSTGVYLNYVELVKPWFGWWTLSIINLVGLIFIVLFVVETKGKSLEEVQGMFESKRWRFFK